MSNYKIFADSACDISEDLLRKRGVVYCNLTFKFQDDEKELANNELPAKEFYRKMRAGGIAKTAAINVATFETAFEQALQEGYDVLYIGFSSGISTTYNSARLAATTLQEKYPDRKIITVDSLAASAGYGLLLHLALLKKEEGADIETVARYTEVIRLNICHWFTVDDLVYLKRGGRISAASAIVGGLLGIKPVLHVDNDGHLINMFKIRGRKAAIKALADQYGELVIDKAAPVFISNGDCEEDALLLKTMLSERFGAEVTLITDIGPVIGAHSGPGTLALFFVGKNR